MSDPTGIIAKIQPAIEKAITSFALSAGAEKLQNADLTDGIYNAIMEHVPAVLKPLVPEQTLRTYLANSQEEIIQRINEAKDKSC